LQTFMGTESGWRSGVDCVSLLLLPPFTYCGCRLVGLLTAARAHYNAIQRISLYSIYSERDCVCVCVASGISAIAKSL
jgi:hypothetical protein